MPIRMTKEMEPPSPPADIPQPRECRKIMWELTKPKYGLSDLILDRSTASQLLDVISYFQNRTLLFETWGLGQRFPQQLCLAVNLYGPPGTGKTMAAHAIAKAVAMPLLCVDYAEIESKYVGETSKNLSALFHTAQETLRKSTLIGQAIGRPSFVLTQVFDSSTYIHSNTSFLLQ